MSVFRSGFSFLFIGGAALLLWSSCGSDDGPTGPVVIDELNLYERLQEREDFGILQQALTKSGLANLLLNDDNSLSFFAPTDAAFNEILPENGIEGITGPELASILAYHVINGAFELEEFETYDGLSNGYLTTRNDDGPGGANLSLFFERAGDFRLNSVAKVSEENLASKNGILHVIDKVLLPPSLADMVNQNPDLSELATAIEVSVFNDLAEAGPNTIFAPVNDAFDSFYNESNYSSAAEIPLDSLQNLLQYHIVPDTNLVDEQVLPDSLYSVSSAAGLTANTFVLSLDTVSNEMNITDFQSFEWKAFPRNIQAKNGIMHLVNGVFRSEN